MYVGFVVGCGVGYWCGYWFVLGVDFGLRDDVDFCVEDWGDVGCVLGQYEFYDCDVGWFFY